MLLQVCRLSEELLCQEFWLSKFTCDFKVIIIKNYISFWIISLLYGYDFAAYQGSEFICSYFYIIFHVLVLFIFTFRAVVFNSAEMLIKIHEVNLCHIKASEFVIGTLIASFRVFFRKCSL